MSGAGSRRSLVLWIVRAGAAALGLLWLAQGVTHIRDALTHTPWDFTVDYRLARAYLEGYSPYTPDGAHRAGLDHRPSDLGHPPSTAFWALPFALGDVKTGATALALLCTALLAVEIVTLARNLSPRSPAITAWLGFTYVVSSDFFAYHVRVGQISQIIGFCLFLTWLAVRNDRQWLAGVALGIACSLKPFPGVVGLLLLVQKRYRAVAIAVALYAAVSLVMTARFGWSSWLLFLDVQKAVANDWLDSIQNQSLHGIITHLYRPTCLPHGPVIRAATLLSSALSLFLVGAACWLARRAPRTRDDAELLVAAFIPLAMFTSQWAWEHYNVILVVPFAVAASRLAIAWREGKRRPWVSAGAACLLFALAAARLPMAIKQSLQRAVRGGNESRHVLLHVFEALNSAPLVLLVIVTWTLVITRLRTNSARIPVTRIPGITTGTP